MVSVSWIELQKVTDHGNKFTSLNYASPQARVQMPDIPRYVYQLDQKTCAGTLLPGIIW
jgi:hypothetical protein